MNQPLPDMPTAKAIIELARGIGAPIEYGGSTHLMVPPGWTATDISKAVEHVQTEPYRKKGTLTALSLYAFIAMLADQNSGWARIYADPEATSLVAVLNDCHSSSKPAWRDHRIVYKAEFSREFKTWQQANRRQMTQAEFAEFLEDNIADVAEPAGDVLLRIASTLSAKTDIDFKSSRRLDNGQVQLVYVETINATAGEGQLDIPREFAIGVRIFRAGDGYKIRARLKYRLGAGGVKFWFELDQVDRAVEDAFAGYITKAAEITNVPTFLGRP